MSCVISYYCTIKEIGSQIKFPWLGEEIYDPLNYCIVSPALPGRRFPEPKGETQNQICDVCKYRNIEGLGSLDE